MKWRLESSGLFYDANEGSVVYYDPDSGDTHLLSEFAACVLRAFNNKAVDTQELLRALQTELTDHTEAELQDATTAILEELVAMHILKSA